MSTMEQEFWVSLDGKWAGIVTEIVEGAGVHKDISKNDGIYFQRNMRKEPFLASK